MDWNSLHWQHSNIKLYKNCGMYLMMTALSYVKLYTVERAWQWLVNIIKHIKHIKNDDCANCENTPFCKSCKNLLICNECAKISNCKLICVQILLYRGVAPNGFRGYKVLEFLWPLKMVSLKKLKYLFVTIKFLIYKMLYRSISWRLSH